MELELTTLPEDSEQVDMRMVALGGGISGKITYLVEVSEDDDGKITASFTLSNAPGVGSQEEALAQHVEFVSGMLEVLKDAIEGEDDDGVDS